MLLFASFDPKKLYISFIKTIFRISLYMGHSKIIAMFKIALRVRHKLYCLLVLCGYQANYFYATLQRRGRLFISSTYKTVY